MSKPMPGVFGTRHVAVDDHDRFGDDVLRVEAGRRADVAGQRESGQRGECGVGCPADARLEHPAAPDRDPAIEAEVVDPDRFEIAADPTGLDVGDLAGAELDGVGGAGRRDE